MTNSKKNYMKSGSAVAFAFAMFMSSMAMAAERGINPGTSFIADPATAGNDIEISNVLCQCIEDNGGNFNSPSVVANCKRNLESGSIADNSSRRRGVSGFTHSAGDIL